MATQSKLGGIGRALRHRNYRYYWMGGAVSVLGFWLHKLALGWLTWDLTHSPLWLGIIGFSATFVTAVIAPFAGGQHGHAFRVCLPARGFASNLGQLRVFTYRRA